MATILVELFKHNTWANLRLIDVCAGLSEEQLAASVPGTFGGVRDTLVHIVAAQEGYLSRLEAKELTNPIQRGQPLGFEELRERARRSSEGLEAVAARMAEDRVLHGTWRGQPYAIPASIFLTQAINHGTEHRAHVNTILTQQGVEPPAIDAWAYQDASGRG
jgi:uncharacterized damage-inducible protein DinB